MVDGRSEIIYFVHSENAPIRVDIGASDACVNKAESISVEVN